MGGGLVSESPSSKGAGGEQRPCPLFAYTKFYEVFPYYLAIGMTAEQFWEQDCTLVKYYRRAAEIRQELKNQDAWLQGVYFYEALGDIAPVLHAFAKKGTKPTPYRKEPYPLRVQNDQQKKEIQEQNSDAKAKAYMEMFTLANNKKFDKKGGVKNGS